MKNYYSLKEDDRKNENEPLVKISPEGKLTTFARLGRTILVISNGDSDVWSKQRMIVSIEVNLKIILQLNVPGKFPVFKLHI